MSVKTTIRDGIATLTLSNPPLNILTREILAHLRAALDQAAGHPDLRVVLVTAEGKHFSAGADVGEHLPPEHEQLIPEFLDTIGRLYAFPLPTIAAVRGRCLGGGFEVAQAVDLVVAGEGAAFGQPEIVLGVTAPAACALLPQVGSRAASAEVVFTGDPIDAGRALDAGFVARVVANDAVEQEALALAQRIARHSATALRLTKQTLRTSMAGRTVTALETAGRIYIDQLMKTEDALEGLNAFLEKREAVWKHR